MEPYVSASKEGPKDWALRLCAKYALYKILGEKDCTIRVDHICHHKARYNTAYKAMKDMGLVASAQQTSLSNEAEVSRDYRIKLRERDSYIITVNGAKFREYASTLAEAPEFPGMSGLMDTSRSYDTKKPMDNPLKAYRCIDGMSSSNILWVYFHQDEYDIKPLPYVGNQLGCFPKDKLEALANAIYTAKVLCYCVKHRDFQIKTTLGVQITRSCQNITWDEHPLYEWRIPEGRISSEEVDPITEEMAAKNILGALRTIRQVRKALKEQLAVRKAIKNLGGSAVYQSKYVSMVKKHLAEEGFLYVNTEDGALKELVTIALEGTYLGYQIM